VYAPVEALVGEPTVDGLLIGYPDDEALLQQGMVMFEALARSFGAKESTPLRSAAAPRSKKGRRR